MNSTHQSPLRCQIQFHSTPTVFRFCHWLHIEKYVHQKHSRPARSIIRSLSPPGGLKARMNDKLYFYFLPTPKKNPLLLPTLWQNVGKAVRFSCRCLLAGLQSLASVYTSPAAAAATVVTEAYQRSSSSFSSSSKA